MSLKKNKELDEIGSPSNLSSNLTSMLIEETLLDEKEFDSDNLNTERNLDNVPLHSDGMTAFITNEDEMKGKLTDWNDPPRQDDKILSIAVVGKEQKGKLKMIYDNFFDEKLPPKNSDTNSDSKFLVDWGYSPRRKLLVLNTAPQSPVTSTLITNKVIYTMMASSDVIIYYVKANNIYEEVFEFLHHFSNCYSKYFSPLFQRMKRDGTKMTACQPQIIIYKATKGNWIIPDNKTDESFNARVNKFAEKSGFALNFTNDIQFASVDAEINGCLKQNEVTRAENFPNALLTKIRNIYQKSRHLRTAESFYSMTKTLHKVYNGQILPCSVRAYPDNLFTCHHKCLICKMTCDRAINHKKSKDLPDLNPPSDDSIFSTHHNISSNCQYRKEKENRRYRCKKCEQDKGIKNSILSVVPGSLYLSDNVQCPRCGDLGVKKYDEPSADIAITEDIHNWADEKNVRYSNVSQGTRTLMENVTSSFHNMAKYVVAEQKNCVHCNKSFNGIIRNVCIECKYLMCSQCTEDIGKGKRCIPCKERAPQTGAFGSVISSLYDATYSGVTSATSTVKGIVTHYANPDYWEKDQDIKKCNICKKMLDIHSALPEQAIHHCRVCGKGVCNNCSLNRVLVPEKGFPNLTRCCDNCFPNREEGKRYKKS